MKYLKRIALFIFIGVGALGLILLYSFKDIEFKIRNKTPKALTAYITIHSQDTGKDYSYPLLGGALIGPNEETETFYTLDTSASGTTCSQIVFRDLNKKVIHKQDCPKQDDIITLN